ncbi:DNA mismatch repair protein MutS [Desertibacillus haloalkaliphilus]|uniref:DNA mismatch repair protein MutS n=1 Tax=Desertibacillus haloalkaliphilus TaxID=1328930 RepID=UPI001C266124|nr:DNA mismatch repair protein MutS [Desertibacillus haloalkaliphilus]MBU8907376.1 DNA mismatch repair protein MutS [Desertibacillus haloalkaliphilus]
MAQHTPMIQQYLQIKAQYKDAFLFFRLGDFYELFFEDAKKASQELEITLTGRGTGDDKIPMCGVPHHSADDYISQLIEKGYKIAICEQVEDPRQAKGVVKREVVQLITPGTVMEGKTIHEKENNYLIAITDFEDGSFGLARTDLTTGENLVTLITGDFDEVLQELGTIKAKELIVSTSFAEEYTKRVNDVLTLTLSYEDEETVLPSFEPLVKHLEQKKLISTFARLTHYLARTQKRTLDHLQPVQYYTTNDHMKIDLHSMRNLELVETLREKRKKGSLLWLLDETVTAMGGRMLKRWVERPLVSTHTITSRLSMVESLLNHFFEREELRDQLKEVYDLERLAGKVAYGNVNARELLQLKKSLEQVPLIIAMIEQLGNPHGLELVRNVDRCEGLLELLETSLRENPPLSIKEGGMIKEGFHLELDKYRDASVNGKTWIAQLEQREREETGIKTLKIGYNKVFGYYIEVTKANIQYLPEGRYERKQTLSNAERYITPELKEKETLILEAEEKIEQLEYDLFLEIREQVKQYISPLQQLAKCMSEIDVLQGFATVSEQQHYVKPTFSENREVNVIDGRHPVVEKMIDHGDYVANDVRLSRDREILLITGPNMAGKSTYMRQLALIATMAQVGCYVPATEATLPIFDQVFTRIGAADDLASGQSTFMVEMLETKHALAKATQDSLILLDEIGRGTSTYDGMALAQSIIEYIHDEVGAKTLFSTHYHELTALEAELLRLQNVHVSAVEENGKVVFLHKVIDGQADRSYGIYVAELADLPHQVITRAQEILSHLETQNSNIETVPAREPKVVQEKPVAIATEAEQPVQLPLFETEQPEEQKGEQALTPVEQSVIKKMKKLDVLNMSPIEAIQQLNELQKKLR